jgi:hypothetical protein
MLILGSVLEFVVVEVFTDLWELSRASQLRRETDAYKFTDFCRISVLVCEEEGKGAALEKSIEKW